MLIIFLSRSQHAFPVELSPRGCHTLSSVREHLELTDGRKQWITKLNVVYDVQ